MEVYKKLVMRFFLLAVIWLEIVICQESNLRTGSNSENNGFYTVSSQVQASSLVSNSDPSTNGNRVNYSFFFGSGEDRKNSRTSFLNFYSGASSETNPPILQLKNIHRESNGSFNNLGHPQWGSIYQPLLRKSPARYIDNISKPIAFPITPRQISNILGKMGPNDMKHQSNGNLSMAFTFWGQFIDHDISLTQQGQEESIKIPIPWCDEYLDLYCQGNSYINFKRSSYIEGTKPRLYANSITSWIDASMIYGSNQATSKDLRTFSKGKLRQSRDNLLPEIQEHGFTVFKSGDIRANQNIFLTTYHTIFFRQHNRICEQLSQKYSYLTDQELYDIGRNYVAALIQKITFDQFLPILLGQNAYDRIINKYQGYRPEVNPQVSIEFSTAGFRIGHALLVDRYFMVNEDHSVAGDFTLNQLFFHPELISDKNLTKIMRGLRHTAAKKKDAKVIDSIRNMLITAPGSEIKLDLYSLNIQRAKDHGLPSYNAIREAYGLKPIKQFSEIVKDQTIALQLDFIYLSPDDCDAWVGIIAEDSFDGGVLGQLGIQIVGQQFHRLRESDHYWYQKSLPPSIIRQIKSTTLQDIITRNTGLQKQNKSMFQVIHF